MWSAAACRWATLTREQQAPGHRRHDHAHLWLWSLAGRRSSALAVRPELTVAVLADSYAASVAALHATQSSMLEMLCCPSLAGDKQQP